MALHHTLLGLLSFRPMTGYQMKQMFESSVIHFWNAHMSQIYRELSHMEKKGLVTFYVEPQEGKPDKKIYSLTDEGNKEFMQWLREFPDNQDEMFRSEFLARVFFASHMNVSDLAYGMKRYIHKQEVELETFKKYENDIKDFRQEGETALFRYMILRRGIKSVETSIEWGKECLDLIEKMSKK